jgi:HPt (histidine-containing phosphotransfer) domain-containing protein
MRSCDGQAPAAVDPEVSGEPMVRRWLEAQDLPELRELVLENLATSMRPEIEELGRAVDVAARDAIHRRAHAIKGWSGTFKMDELYEPVHELDAISASDDLFDRGRARELMAEVTAVVSRIPERFLSPAPGDLASGVLLATPQG